MVSLSGHLPIVTTDSTERAEHMKTYKKWKLRQDNTFFG